MPPAEPEAVIGVPDEEAGELPKALVVLEPGPELTAEALRAFVDEHVSSYKHVRIVAYGDAIPRSASGGILRRLLRDAKAGRRAEGRRAGGAGAPPPTSVRG